MQLKKRILLEIVFFVVIFLAYQGEGFNVSKEAFFISITIYIILYIHGLFNRFLILPIITKEKKYFKYIFFTIITLLIFSSLIHQISLSFVAKYDPGQLAFVTFYNSLASGLLSLFVMSSLEFVFQYVQREKEKADYTAIIKQLENNNLKAQLNPHFLFNSLNNAYGISLSNPERTPQYIMQLSQLMRYQLESTKSEFVLLKDDIEFVENYIALERERLGNRCLITYENTIDANALLNYKLAPMLFHTFIENAIKHGASSIEPSYIKIKFSNQANIFYFEIENSIANTISVGTQLGLKNVEQRLGIMYLNAHELKIYKTEASYLVNLKITLSLNV